MRLPPNPNIVMYCPTVVGGHPRYCAELLAGIAAAAPPGVRLTLLTGDALPASFDNPSYTVVRRLQSITHRDRFRTTFGWILNRAMHYPRINLALLRYGRDLPRGAVIHVQEIFFPLAPFVHGLLRRVYGHKVVATVHNVVPHAYPRFVPRAVYDAFGRWAWRSADVIIVHTEGQARLLRGRLGGGAPPVHAVPHGVWRPRARHRKEAPDGRLRLLCYGTIRSNKGFELLLRALEMIERPVSVTIAGGVEDSAYARRLEQEAARVGCGRHQVRLDLRYIPDDEVPALFAAHDLMVLPYRHFEAQSGVLHDALSYGMPVVATSVGGLGETVRAEGIGAVVPEEDVAALGSAIDALELDDLRQWSANVQALADRHSWRNVGRLTLRAYEGYD